MMMSTFFPWRAKDAMDGLYDREVEVEKLSKSPAMTATP